MVWEGLKNICAGAMVGVANIIPGVSGGTMAVVLGIYDRLIDSLSLRWQKLKKNFWFLLTVGVGALAGIFAFSVLIDYLLGHYNMPTNFAFVGIILGSIPMIYRKTTVSGAKPYLLVPFAVTFVVMTIIAFITPSETQQAMTSLNAGNALYLFLSAILGAVAMIIPGLSGSFIMLVLGAYQTVLTAISDLNIPILIPVALGVAVGILGGAKVIGILLKKFPYATYSAILGLVLGSVVTLLVNVFRSGNVNSSPFLMVISVAVLILGAIVTYFTSRMEK